jgi:hypothetical protein
MKITINFAMKGEYYTFQARPRLLYAKTLDLEACVLMERSASLRMALIS